MKKILALVLFVMTAFSLNGAYAQAICGNEILQEKINTDPYLKSYFDDYYKQYDTENKQMAAQQEHAAAKGTAAEYTIPVVFHIVLSQAQINQLGGEAGVIERIGTQLLVINEDFNASNNDKSTVPAAFTSVIGDAKIGFGLAKRNPQGKAQIGITWKIQPSTFAGFAADDQTYAVKRTVLGGTDPWDINKYLNIWVTLIKAPSSGGQVLGYGFNKSYAVATTGDPNLAGVVMHYLTLGRRTDLNQAFYNGNTDRGRTLTHELGHYFNIWHIWGKTTPSGQSNCFEDDGIDDTPEQASSNMNCPTGIKANCSNSPHTGGEMYMNFMDYSGDGCTKLFSKGQVNRMRSELNAGGQLETLGKNPQLAFWPTDVSAMEYNNKVDIAPNPTSGVFNITFADKFNKLNNIIITNTVGQVQKTIVVTDQQLMNYTVDAGNMASGVYLVQMNFEEGVISRKVIIQ